ncbi:hypothetical protein [Nocardiopsis dassonvillei]|uniref:hypothetical protein n=1 Tax=Nocardiopsis dassonvillei TaxID=2014 RepID=UPI00034A05A7|nr:hypothetical protein [Nocardiopsis dassonvillei]MCK9872402.1 hypothetical protein [Nocardiopsis dassonvillei]
MWELPEMQQAWEKRDASAVIRLVRWNTDLSLTALVKLTGLAQSTLSGIISGKVELKNLDKINTALEGLSPFCQQVREAPQESRPERVVNASSPPWSAHRDALDMEECAHALEMLEKAYTTVPSTTVLAQIGPLHGQLSQIMSAEHEAQRLRARSNLLMGQVLWDASQRRDIHTAIGHLDEAAVIAQAIGDHGILAHALLRRSFIPLYSPTADPQLALVTARRAMITAHEDRELRALAALHVSEAHARLHSHFDAEQHLDHADALARGAPDIDSGAWEGRRLRIAGSVYLELDQPSRAQSILEQAVHVLSDRPKTRGIALANLSLAHVRQQEIEGATSVLHHAMDLSRTTHAGGATPLIASVVRELAPWRTVPAVVDVQDRFIDLLTR